jgi:hypothetical protein
MIKSGAAGHQPGSGGGTGSASSASFHFTARSGTLALWAGQQGQGAVWVMRDGGSLGATIEPCQSAGI